MSDIFESFIAFLLCAVVVLGILLGLISLLLYINYKVDVRLAIPCIEVYDKDELLYKGNEYFSHTESRGTSTMWYENEKTWFFPKKLNERISPNIKSRNCR